MVNGKWLPDFIERWKASAWHQLYLPLLPFTHARSKSINADSLNFQLTPRLMTLDDLNSLLMSVHCTDTKLSEFKRIVLCCWYNSAL